MSDEDPFDALCTWVEAELDFATSHYNDSYLDRRIASRMRRSRTSTYEDYLELLQDDPEEQTALLDALSINVTGFFRNPDVWDGIRDILRSLSGTRDEIRVWCAACADGREPYSVAMVARDDDAIDGDAVTVLGTDISEPALETARTGVYRSTRTIDIDEQLRYLSEYTPFVSRDGSSFRIEDSVREAVEFRRHDLINDEPLSGFDVVICRNLFIYIDTEHKAVMLETISESLRQGGYLVIGKTETIPPSLRSDFEVSKGRLRIYKQSPAESPSQQA